MIRHAVWKKLYNVVFDTPILVSTPLFLLEKRAYSRQFQITIRDSFCQAVIVC